MTDLPTATLGRTGLTVTTLGYGAMELRGPGAMWGRDISDDDATALLNAVLDGGINYLDTSPDYGMSEERIGKAIAGRRDEYVLASKCGCPVGTPGFREHIFTRENIRAAVEQSLKRMQTDRVEVVQFHASPAQTVMEENDSVAELEALKSEGKIRFLGMSGTLPHLTDHVAMGVFDVFQIPYSAVEREHEASISSAAAAGAGTVIRGGVRQRYMQSLDRYESAGLDEILDGMSRLEFMLRFTLTHPDMHTTIVGTANPAHLAANLAAAQKGVLPADVYEAAKKRLDSVA